MANMARRLHNVAMATSLVPAVAAFLCGCNAGPSPSDIILAPPENDAFAEGNLSPDRITRIVVYLYPPKLYMASRYSELARSQKVDVPLGGAARDLVAALAAGPSDIRKRSGHRTMTGMIEVVIVGGKRLFLHYDVSDTPDLDVYVCPPGKPGQEPRGHWQDALLPWLNKYVYTQLQQETSGSTSAF